jgi:hypothetical protein
VPGTNRQAATGIRELKASGDGIQKIGGKLGIGTGLVWCSAFSDNSRCVGMMLADNLQAPCPPPFRFAADQNTSMLSSLSRR